MSLAINSTNDYINAIPKNTPKAMLYSFGISALVSTVATASLPIGIFAGVLGATAAGINGLVTPIFRSYFKEADFGTTMLKHAVVFLTLAALETAIGLPGAIAAVPLTLLIIGAQEMFRDGPRSLNTVSVYPFFIV